MALQPQTPAQPTQPTVVTSVKQKRWVPRFALEYPCNPPPPPAPRRDRHALGGVISREGGVPYLILALDPIRCAFKHKKLRMCDTPDAGHLWMPLFGVNALLERMPCRGRHSEHPVCDHLKSVGLHKKFYGHNGTSQNESIV